MLQPVLPYLYLCHRGLAGIYSADEHFYKFSSPDWQGDSVIFGSEILRLSHIKAFVESELIDIAAEIDELTFHSPEFNLSSDGLIYDDPSNLQGSWCFLDDKRNTWSTQPTLIDHILNDDALFARYAYRDESSGRLLWKPSPCLTHGKKTHNITMRIFMLVILTFGGACRGTELLSMLLRNIGNGSIRNLLILFGIITMRASYNKTSAATHSDKPIVRVPLPPVGRLLVRVLVFLRPFFSHVQSIFHPHLHHDSVHLLLPGFDRQLDTHDLSDALEGVFERWNIQKMNFRTYRQFVAFILQCNNELFRMEHSVSGAASQLGHSAEMNRTNYAGDSRFPSGLNDTMYRENALTSAKYHRLLGFPPDLLHAMMAGRERQTLINQEIHRCLGRIPPAPPQGPNGHSFSMQELVYAVEQTLMPSFQSTASHMVSQAVATFAHIVHPKPQPSADHNTEFQPPHILLVKLFREFLQRSGAPMPQATFYNAAQRNVVLQMMVRKDHIAYISGTGERASGPSCSSKC